MRQNFVILLLAGLCALLVSQACKTTSANYRAAYQKTMAAKDSADAELDETIYGRARKNYGTGTVVVAGDTVKTKVQFVRVTENGGGTPDMLLHYCVVAAQFKQVFNARSMQQRLAEGGFPSAMVVETGEPYYYVVAASYNDMEHAVNTLKSLERDKRFTLRQPCPFILEVPRMPN